MRLLIETLTSATNYENTKGDKTQMKNNLLLEASYEIFNATVTMKELGLVELLTQRVEEEGITLEEFTMAHKLTETLDKEKTSEYIIGKSIDKYIENLKKMINYAQMAQAYQEMGNLNLQISEEFSELENEGDKTNEMVGTQTESKAE